MTSNPVNSLVTLTRSELLAMLKLVQRGNETIHNQWIEDCMTAFGWSQETAIFVTEGVRRLAKRELARAART